tara:strand:- start:1039 stop:1656 length:618 start_codon:yes stop_codon:yes gene_type:complete
MQIDIKLHKNDLPDEIKLDDKKSLAVDSEFSGLNINRDKLYLVQLSTGNNDAHIIQLNRENYNAPNLKKILADEKIEKIFHFARADMVFIKKHLNIDVKNVSCTKIMSKIARSYSDRHGLKDLAKEFLGIDLNKQSQSTDFGGELNEKQLKYCANDVIHLHKIYSNLKEILVREKRYELYSKAINCIDARVELDLASFTEDIWSH